MQYLIPELQSLLEGKRYPSWMRVPIQVAVWDSRLPVSLDTVRLHFNHHAHTPATYLDFDFLFKPYVFISDWEDELHPIYAEFYNELVAWLRTHLANIQVIRVEQRPPRIYVLGEIPGGEICGISFEVFD